MANTVEELLSVISPGAGYYRGEADKYAKHFENVYNDYNTDLDNLYNNEHLISTKGTLEKYLDTHKDKMDVVMLDKFNYLLSKYDIQEEDNVNYITGMEEARDYGLQIEKVLNKYNDIFNQESFRRQKSDGTWYFEDAGGEWNEEDLERYRTEERGLLKNELTDLTKRYSDFVGGFKNTHAERQNKPGFHGDAYLLDSLKEYYMFGINQTTQEDQLFDNNERDAYLLAISSGSSQSITDYINKEANLNKALITDYTTEIGALYDTGDYWQSILDKRSGFLEKLNPDSPNYDPEEAATMGTLPLFNVGEGTSEMTYSYEDLLEPGSEANLYLNEQKSEIENFITKMNNINNILSPLVGTDYLSKINISTSDNWKNKFPGVQFFKGAPPTTTTTISPESITVEGKKFEVTIEPYTKSWYNLHKQYNKEELDLAQSFIDEDKVPDKTINMEVYEALGGKHKLKPKSPVPYSVVNKEDYTKNLKVVNGKKKYGNAVERVVTKINNLSNKISVAEPEYNKLNDYHDLYSNRIKDIETKLDEEIEKLIDIREVYTKGGFGYLSKERKDIRKKIKNKRDEKSEALVKAKSEYNNRFRLPIHQLIARYKDDEELMDIIKNLRKNKDITAKSNLIAYFYSLRKHITKVKTSYDDSKGNLQYIVEQGSK
jgi:hypothetical protein